ncbi:hypothetical protein [Paenibacillus endoradicis]|uniref:hypothetical protein n=1 Tax=Paenibacillus endoradicis TaxID=2972487 RepID=UPI002159217F|nr:hypothetical protein [Paenibacillus endoradicis]MCR8660661.1 hypothetical protein [Paenibacillus endoradicis]
MKNKDIFTKYFCEMHSIDFEEEANIIYVKARDLICAERLDLIVKFKYVEHKNKGYDLSYIKEVYHAHIEAFSNGTFTEPGTEEKNSINKYFKEFDLLIDSIEREGVNYQKSVIPLGSNNVILDGSHRVAIAAYYNLEIPVVFFEELSVCYDYKFFEKRLLDKSYIDFLVLEYIKLKKNVFFACIWPKSTKMNLEAELNKILHKESEFFYTKKLNLNYDGLRNLMTQIYSQHDWIGDYINNFRTVNKKVDNCYEEDQPMLIYVFESNHLSKVLSLKEKIRQLYNIGNHSIHITDNDEESIQIGKLLLNENSISFLNNGKPDIYKNVYRRILNFKDNLIESNFDLDESIITSSSILSMYGLREANDLDFISCSKNSSLLITNEIGCHNEYIKLYDKTIEELIFNPNNYFYYLDIKFVSINAIKKFKINRNEKKDVVDIELINTLDIVDSKLSQIIRLKNHKLKIKWRNLGNKSRIVIISVLKRLGLFDISKKLYLKVKGISNE